MIKIKNRHLIIHAGHFTLQTGWDPAGKGLRWVQWVNKPRMPGIGFDSRLGAFSFSLVRWRK